MQAEIQIPDRCQFVKRKRMAYRTAHCKMRRQLAMPLKGSSLSRTTRHFPIFPPELYGNIFEWITDRQDLYNLSLTSRACSVEAQRILYTTVDLAPNTETPVLWANTILRHPHHAAMVRHLTLRLDLSFIIIPHLLLPSLQTIAQALKALRRLEKLVLIGHPLAMMHHIYAWILDGCTANLRVFHNSVFSPWAIVPFLSRHPQLHEWKQTGMFPGGSITDSILPHLTTLHGHVSTLASFKAPRSLVRVCLKIDNWEAIEALSPFGTTLTTLTVDDTSTGRNHFGLAELLIHLAKATPNLQALAYTRTSTHSILAQDLLSPDCIENLSKLGALETLILQLRCQNLCTDAHRVRAMAEQAFDLCPSLHCVALKDAEVYSYCRREGSHVAEEDVGALFSDLLDDEISFEAPSETPCDAHSAGWQRTH